MAETRRSILKAAAALSAFTTLPLPAQTPTPAPAATPTPTPADAKKPTALARVARERYGKFLSEAEQALMDEDMAFVDTRSARLRKLRLENGEEPVVDFRTLRP